MGSPSVPYPDYLITLVDAGPGAGAGVPGAAVRDAGTGRVTDRVAGELDVFSAVAGTGTNRRFFLAVRGDPQSAVARGPQETELPHGGVISARIDDAGKITELSAVLGVLGPGPGRPGPVWLAATADGSKVAYPAQRRPPPPLRPGQPPELPRPADAPPPEVHIITTATGYRAVWRDDSARSIGNLSLSADGRRMAFDRNAANDGGTALPACPR